MTTLTVFLAACTSGDDDAPATLPDVTPTVTEVQSPEPTATPVPEETTPEPDPTAALEAEITEFFEEYIDAVNESWTSEAALERRREMFADSCDECLAGYNFAELKHREKLVLDAGSVEVRQVDLTSWQEDSVVFVAMMDAPAGRLATSEGEVVQAFEEYLGVQIVYQAVRSDEGSWVIIKGDAL